MTNTQNEKAAQREIENLKKKLAETVDRADRETISKTEVIGRLTSANDRIYEELKLRGRVEGERDNLKDEVIKLKAKLYDLLTKKEA